MANDLITTGSLTDIAVRDVVSDLHLVARNAADMKAAQDSMSLWFGGKLEIARADHADLQQSLEISERNGWESTALKRQVRNALKRVEFFEKCQAASQAGYCIVPNMPAEVFAIRTNRVWPTRTYSRYDGTDFHKQSSESPPQGQGEYYDSSPKLRPCRDVLKHDENNKPVYATFFAADEFAEIEFPISVAIPLVMTATAEAMALKVFDELHVLPGRKRKGDPLVLGVIYKPGKPKTENNQLSFLIGWHVDTRTL